MQAYGFFDLIVEVGSSLGLWIGLSALGVLDLALDQSVRGRRVLRDLLKK